MNKEEIVRKELRLIVRELGLLNHNCFNSGLTLAQSHILKYLKQNGTTTFNEILIHLGIDKASLSRIVSNLEARNYLESKRSETDKRMKDIYLLPSGLEAINKGDYKANVFMDEILNQGDRENIDDIVKAFRVFRILALKTNLKKNDSRILIEKISENYREDAVRLATEVFTNEQGIPTELIPLDHSLNPIWWCARVGEDLVGVVAAWKKDNKWHWGRFAVDKGLRGVGIGQKLAVYSLKEFFSQHTDELYSDARDITVNMLMRFGCEIIGETETFYGEAITPIVLKKESFNKYFE
ncbi:bifunctional helix-turn-helix transcriptional regulator/GNAT family N-acetyltransferase [Fusibacter ferrireducens]|uniref:Bifunctional helix-turn-helix transcriptional regulator/GNAT family N-acetyltransferase n=1 Tax=Fusibacter ferrireducens TaxID=2785058 RepID=A0ABR9ZPA2_9FIRM|nr:bifunctional helix-turn-helix transcriptional regulator/GNAT family N-acetyltransferase [Fusibacter ferrireducens]MBF4692151.1 bifunctional helix-turn-helix transcriptional regulator/GNAT family N-acetyltransferase [Fusibacter ferrireducens]